MFESRQERDSLIIYTFEKWKGAQEADIERDESKQ